MALDLTPDPSSAAALPGFSIALHDAWTVVDVDQLDRDQIVQSMRSAAAAGELPADHLPTIESLLTHHAAALDETDLAFLAVLLAEDEDSGVVFASLTITYHVAEGSLELEAASSTSQAPAARASSSTVTPVVVGGREGWRLQDLKGVSFARGVEQQILSVQYVLPTEVPGVTLIATATSPSVTSRAALEIAFDQALETLELAEFTATEPGLS